MTVRKVALISGGRRGIGRGIALALADAGFDIVINDLEHDEEAQSTLQMLEERKAKACFVASDLSDVSTHADLVDTAYRNFGRLDCLVNNAGRMCVRGDLLDATSKDFDAVLGVNLRATFFLSQEAAR